MAKLPQKKDLDLRGLIDDQAEMRLHITVRQIYEYIDRHVENTKENLEAAIKAGQIAPSDVMGLVNLFSTPLAGSSVTDPLLQTLTQNFGAQLPNVVFAGPTPSFRALTLADLPTLPVNNNILHWVAL